MRKRRGPCYPRRTWAWPVWHECRTHWLPSLTDALDNAGVQRAGLEACLIIAFLTIVALLIQTPLPR